MRGYIQERMSKAKKLADEALKKADEDSRKYFEFRPEAYQFLIACCMRLGKVPKPFIPFLKELLKTSYLDHLVNHGVIGEMLKDPFTYRHHVLTLVKVSWLPNAKDALDEFTILLKKRENMTPESFNAFLLAVDNLVDGGRFAAEALAELNKFEKLDENLVKKYLVPDYLKKSLLGTVFFLKIIHLVGQGHLPPEQADDLIRIYEWAYYFLGEKLAQIVDKVGPDRLRYFITTGKKLQEKDDVDSLCNLAAILDRPPETYRFFLNLIDLRSDKFLTILEKLNLRDVNENLVKSFLPTLKELRGKAEVEFVIRIIGWASRGDISRKQAEELAKEAIKWDEEDLQIAHLMNMLDLKKVMLVWTACKKNPDLVYAFNGMAWDIDNKEDAEKLINTETIKKLYRLAYLRFPMRKFTVNDLYQADLLIKLFRHLEDWDLVDKFRWHPLSHSSIIAFIHGFPADQRHFVAEVLNELKGTENIPLDLLLDKRRWEALLPLFPLLGGYVAWWLINPKAKLETLYNLRGLLDIQRKYPNAFSLLPWDLFSDECLITDTSNALISLERIAKYLNKTQELKTIRSSFDFKKAFEAYNKIASDIGEKKIELKNYGTNIATVESYLEMYSNATSVINRWVKEKRRLDYKTIVDVLVFLFVNEMEITNEIKDWIYTNIREWKEKNVKLTLEEAAILNVIADVKLMDILRSLKVEFGDIKAEYLETIRLDLNNKIPTAGDFAVVAIIQKIIMSMRELSDIERAIPYLEQLYNGPSNFSDVNTFYRTLGRFLANRVAEIILLKQSKFKKMDKAFKEKVETVLGEYGIQLPEKASSIKKVWWYLQKLRIGPVIKKAYRKLKPSKEICRFPSSLNLEITQEPVELLAGARMYQVKIKGIKTDIKILLVKMPKDKVRMGFTVKVGGGAEAPEKGKILEAVGAYTTGHGKPTEFCAVDGAIKNELISEREGLLVISEDGEAKIIHITEAIGNYDFSKWISFRNEIREKNLSVMQQHLLLYKGEIMVDPVNSSPARDHRRLLVMFKEHYAILDISDATLYEAALIAQNLGAESAINLDTGYYDYSAVYDKNGNPTYLGLRDKSGSSNLLYFLPKD